MSRILDLIEHMEEIGRYEGHHESISDMIKDAREEYKHSYIIQWSYSDQVWLASTHAYPSVKTHGKTPLGALRQLVTVLETIELSKDGRWKGRGDA